MVVGQRIAALLAAAAALVLLADISDRAQQRGVSLEQLRGLGEAARTQGLDAGWIVPDNGVVTTINTRGYANDGGSISYNPNFVYGATGTPVVQADPTRDQAWRYSDDPSAGMYHVVTAATNGGATPDYELINTGPYQSDGTEWGTEPVPAQPVYGYFPKQLYPGSGGYNYPGAAMSPAIGKAAWVAAHGGGVGGSSGAVEASHIGLEPSNPPNDWFQ